MLIDWFTVGAQMINFVILVWLLRHFLYRPMLDAIVAREESTAAIVADASAKQLSAQTALAELTRKNSDFDQQRADLSGQATAQAGAEYQRLLAVLQTDIAAERARHLEALAADYRQLGTEISRRAGQQVLAMTRKTLLDLGNTTLEQAICQVFIARLRTMESVARTAMVSAIKSAGGSARYRTSAVLSPEQQSALSSALDEVAGIETRPVFSVDPTLISGIELQAHSYKLTWNIDDYLTSLGDSIEQLIRQRAHADANADIAVGPAPPATPRKPS